MAKAFGPYTQDRATKERSQFVSKVKEVWLKNDSPFALVNNIIFTDVKTKWRDDGYSGFGGKWSRNS